MADAFVIEELWTDSLENHIDAAMGYRPVGVVMFESIAKKVVEDGGKVNGTGWPIKEGESMPKYRYSETPIVDDPAALTDPPATPSSGSMAPAPSQ